MQRYEKVTMGKKQIFINNLIGGIAWGLGATVGLSIVLAILTLIAKNINVVPVVGDFVSEVLKFVLQKNPHLLK